MEENQNQPIIKGVFAFDEKGFLYLGAAFFALVAAALAVVFRFVSFEMGWLLTSIAAVIALLFGLAAFIGKLMVRRKRFAVYPDRVEYRGAGQDFVMEVAKIKILKSGNGSVVMLGDEAGHTVEGLLNADDIGRALKVLLTPAPIPEPEEPGPIQYANLAIEELRSAKKLYDDGLISEHDYEEKKRQYLDSASELFIDSAGGSEISKE